MEVDLEGGLEAEDGEGKDRLESLPLDDPEGGLDGGIAALLEAQQRMDSKFPYVLYCAPPSGAAADGVEYADTVYAACQQWNKAGGCVFTSSSAVYYGDDGAFCTEETPALPMGASERSDRLLRAEDACVNHGGCVVRLAGLYHAQRGAHMFYLKQGEVKGRGDALLNLIHYDDAASLVVETLLNGGRCRRYMGVDSSPVSKADVVDATLRSGRFDDMAPEGGVKFASEGVGPTGRRMDNVRTRKMLSWAPRHRSFADFMQAYGRGDAEL
uniref:NAD-dependent epimerase/dehydratase domain-containing protein n=1 Tax=Prasinoderma singulare TaxID=676789 RepID=A0A7S3BNN5_9VIRI|mmetsp:Transcript_1957/g.5666  ORF Transcript_1957/g.5666 Transcript_1957/m.5666 type:complete len:270 (+) Transcript_1957:333-1142(+)